MPLTLQQYANSDTNYVAKLNNNVDSVVAQFNALESRLGATAGAGISAADAFRAMFGTTAAVFGPTHYECTGSGSTLSVAAGYAWSPAAGQVHNNASVATIDFTGLASNTYYIAAPNGPAQSLSPTDALYSVVWNGSAFGTITLLANVLSGLSSNQLNSALARGYQTTRTSITTTGGSGTLSAAQANASVIALSGALASDATLTFPVDGPSVWLIENGTTGDFAVTATAAGGSGVVLPGSGGVAVVYCDGTDILMGPRKLVPLSLASAASQDADFSRAETVRFTMTADTTVALSGAVDGQRLTLEVTQDGTGGHALTMGAEVRYGADIASVAVGATAGEMTRIGLVYHGPSGMYDVVAVATGF